MHETKPYDLEERTSVFAEAVRKFVKQLPRSLSNAEDTKQLIRPSAAIGANYIEANEALSKKDFYYRCKICRKEAKEAAFFLRLVDTGNEKSLEDERVRLKQEATELKLIFNKIIGTN